MPEDEDEAAKEKRLQEEDEWLLNFSRDDPDGYTVCVHTHLYIRIYKCLLLERRIWSILSLISAFPLLNWTNMYEWPTQETFSTPEERVKRAKETKDRFDFTCLTVEEVARSYQVPDLSKYLLFSPSLSVYRYTFHIGCTPSSSPFLPPAFP